jgi:hypothetical protein
MIRIDEMGSLCYYIATNSVTGNMELAPRDKIN